MWTTLPKLAVLLGTTVVVSGCRGFGDPFVSEPPPSTQFESLAVTSSSDSTARDILDQLLTAEHPKSDRQKPVPPDPNRSNDRQMILRYQSPSFPLQHDADHLGIPQIEDDSAPYAELERLNRVSKYSFQQNLID